MPSTGTLGLMLSTTEVFNGLQGKRSSYILFIPHPLCLKLLAISSSPASSPLFPLCALGSFPLRRTWHPAALSENASVAPSCFWDGELSLQAWWLPKILTAPCNAHRLCWSECVSLLKALAQFLPGHDSPEPPCLRDSSLECSVPTYSVRLSCTASIALWEKWLLP